MESDKPRSVVVKFNKYKDREVVLRNAKKLKGTSVFVNEDVSERVLSRRKEQMSQLKDARGQGKIAYFVLDKLVIKERKRSTPLPNAVQPERPKTRSKSTHDQGSRSKVS